MDSSVDDDDESLANFGTAERRPQPRRVQSLPVYGHDGSDDDEFEASVDDLSVDDSSVYTSTSSHHQYESSRLDESQDSNRTPVPTRISAREKLLQLQQQHHQANNMPRPLQRLRSLPSWAMKDITPLSYNPYHGAGMSDDESLDDDSVLLDSLLLDDGKSQTVPTFRNDPAPQVKGRPDLGVGMNQSLTSGTATLGSSSDDDDDSVERRYQKVSTWMTMHADDQDDDDDSVLNDVLPPPPPPPPKSSSPNTLTTSYDSSSSSMSNDDGNSCASMEDDVHDDKENCGSMAASTPTAFKVIDETKSPVDLDETLPLEYLQEGGTKLNKSDYSKKKIQEEYVPVDVDSLRPVAHLISHEEEGEDEDVDVSYSIPSSYSPANQDGRSLTTSPWKKDQQLASSSVQVNVQPLPKDSIYLQMPTTLRNKTQYKGPVDLDDTVSLSSTVATSVAGNHDVVLDDNDTVKVEVKPLPRDSVYLQKPAVTRSMVKYQGPVDLDDTISLTSTIATSVAGQSTTPRSIMPQGEDGRDWGDDSTLNTDASFQLLDQDQSFDMSQHVAAGTLVVESTTARDDSDSQDAEDLLLSYAQDLVLAKIKKVNMSGSFSPKEDPPGERFFPTTVACHSVTGAWTTRPHADDTLQEDSAAAVSLLVTQKEFEQYAGSSHDKVISIPNDISIPTSPSRSVKKILQPEELVAVVTDEEACPLPPVLPKRIPSLFEAPMPNGYPKRSSQSTSTAPPAVPKPGTLTIAPCVLCKTRERSHVCLPCMHFAFCESCVEDLYRISCEDCPVCNTRDAVFSKLNIVEESV
jgi:hypothetical protein